MNAIEFIHDLTWETIPSAVRHQAKRCLLDTLGVAIGGHQTDLARIIRNHAVRAFGSGDTGLWFDGRTVSPVGAALAHGMTIDSLDMHDTCKPAKGHAGVAQVPAILATLGLGSQPMSGKSYIATLTMAYDIACRTGIAQHNTVCDYHTSGAWNAVGSAAVVARRMGLSHEQTRHALGIAEYHGPRSQMMRAIDHPTMLKDGSGWGAMAGVSAGLLAADGFTGAPAITVEADNVSEYWETLGREWLLSIQFFKPYAVCYWAQPALAGVMKIVSEQQLDHRNIAKIEVRTFYESAQLTTRHPRSTDEAQYSLPFPVAALLVHGQLMSRELSGDNLRHPDVLRLAEAVELIEDEYCSERFPAERLSSVTIETTDGARYESGIMEPRWGLSSPPTDDDLLDKFRALASSTLRPSVAAELEAAIWNIETMPDVSELNRLLASATA